MVTRKVVVMDVTFRDMYQSGTDTVRLSGRALNTFRFSVDKSSFLRRLETVDFEAPYVVSIIRIWGDH
jgi:hypothetical protein